ncbi:uncharacterized protein [Euwallacea similis]|uniref:uncharacterized protein isoform X1 n=1 Tax=Euwallacea similis TaxID=1736056 RepID=UPI00344E1F58
MEENLVREINNEVVSSEEVVSNGEIMPNGEELSEMNKETHGEESHNGEDIFETNNKTQEEPMDQSESLSQEKELEPCRLCDNVCEKMFNIFEDNPEGYQLIGLIKENLPIVLYKTDPLSKQVCEKCVLNLQIISSLKKSSRKTQEKYVQQLKTEGDTTDKNVLLFLGCTGSKLVDNGDEEEEEEEELKDQATSTEDLTILCANCKSSILDASTVNGEVELGPDLHEIIRESLKTNRVSTGESEKSLRRRKNRPLYHELEDSLCSSLTDLPGAGDDMSQYGEGGAMSDAESEADSDEQPAKRRKVDQSSKEIQDEINKELAKQKSADEDEEDSSESSSSADTSETDEETKEKLEEEKKAELERIERIKAKCQEMFSEAPDFSYEPLTLQNIVLYWINKQNIPEFEGTTFEKKSTVCRCKTCNEVFQNVNLLALHEPSHMEVDMEEKIDNPLPWSNNRLHSKIRNKWLTFFDENGSEPDEDEEDEEEDDEDNEEEDPKVSGDSALLVEDTEKTMEVSKKDEIVLVNMKPMVNGIYLGDYTKEERKAFYQCMRIGGQTKRFCPLCRYCFKDNWAIESHYFSFACHYTCRYCGMRFNKQRHRFDEHVKEHKKKKESTSEKIYTASKVNNTLPKVIQPDKVKRIVPGEPEQPREIKLEDYASPPVITKGGFDQRNRYSLPERPNFQGLKIKEEPKDFLGPLNKTQNQAYFCRKCYKVFFKLDEFNAHSKNCDYNNYAVNKPGSEANSPKMPMVKVKQEPGLEKKLNGDIISNAGRPLRNCARDIGPYKDEVFIPKQILNETLPGPPQSFICHICGTPFPTIYSRNSHMRIHKGETQGASNGGPSPQMVAQQNILKQRLQQQQQHNFQLQKAAMQQQQQRQQLLRQKQMAQQRAQQQSNYGQLDEVRVKEEPVDSFEPMVEIHEGHERSPSPIYNSSPSLLSGGEISLTPIVKKSSLNPNILKLVQNNPNISLVSKKSSPGQARQNGEGHRTQGGNIIKNAGGYQGPYAPTSQQVQRVETNGNQPGYITVSSNLMPNDDKTYKCSSCWEAFTNKSHLYFHKKNQCEGSRFPCPFCKKRFGTEAAYSSHIFYSHPE